MIKIEDIYNEYLEKINSTHHERYKDHKGWFSASTAGTCFRKQHLKKIGAEEKPFDNFLISSWPYDTAETKITINRII